VQNINPVEAVKGAKGTLLKNVMDGIGRYARGQNVKEVAMQGGKVSPGMTVNDAGFGTDSQNKNDYHADQQEEKIETKEASTELSLKEILSLQARVRTDQPSGQSLSAFFSMLWPLAAASVPTFILRYLVPLQETKQRKRIEHDNRKKESVEVQEEGTLSRIVRTKEIHACFVVLPPSITRNAKTGVISGKDVDRMNAIAKKLGAKVVWHQTTVRDMLADLLSKKCDVLPNSNVLAHSSRVALVSFTELPGEWGGLSALVRKNDIRFVDVKDAFQLDRPDVTIAVDREEAGDLWITEHFKEAKVNRIDTKPNDVTRFAFEVSAGRADVAVADANTIALYAKHHSEVIDLFHAEPFNPTPTGWVVRKEDEQWRLFLQEALQALDENRPLVV